MANHPNRNPKTQAYTVRGIWPFPVDMLRHDDARAASEADQEIITRLSREYAEHCDDFKPVDVGLVREIAHKWSTPNFKRWESFGWRVVPESCPRICAPLPPPKPRRFSIDRDDGDRLFVIDAETGGSIRATDAMLERMAAALDK